MDLQNRYEDVKISIPKTFDNTQKISIKGQNIAEIQEAEKNLLEIVSDREIIQVTFFWFGSVRSVWAYKTHGRNLGNDFWMGR